MIKQPSGGRGFNAPFHVFFGSGQLINITICDGDRLVMFKRGSTPSIVPPDLMPPGIYELTPEVLPGGDYPIGFQVLPIRQAEFVSKLSVQAVNAILDHAAQNRKEKRDDCAR